MKEFFKNLGRYKVSSVLNILGLSLAFAAAYIILVQVNFDLGYNRCFKDAERVYRLDFKSLLGNDNKMMPHVGHPVGSEAGKSSDNVKDFGWAFAYNGYAEFTILRDGQEEESFYLRNRVCSADYPKTLGIALVAGSYDYLNEPNSVLISENLAKTHDLEVGDIVKTEDEKAPNSSPQTIKAIFKDFPENCELTKVDVMQIATMNSTTNKKEFAFTYYYRVLDPELNGDILTNTAQKIAPFFTQITNGKEILPEQDDREGWRKLAKKYMRLTSAYDVYFTNDVDGVVGYSTGNRITTYTLLSIAVLILVIAFINFFNFFMAMVPRRIRRVNTEKVFGCSTRRLRLGFVGEAVGLVTIALALGAYIVFMIAPELNGLISTSAALEDNPKIVVIIIAAAFLLAIISSVYPAYYITSVPPAFALKNSFGNTAAGRRLRYALLTFQFVISIALITCTMFIRLQHTYMLHYDIGFNKANILGVNLIGASKSRWDFNARMQFTNELKANPAIVDAAFASENFLADMHSGHGKQTEKGEFINFQAYNVTWNFLRVMGIEIVEGRDYIPEDEQQSDKQLYIFNETAQRMYDIKVDEDLNGATITGFCRDFKFRSLLNEVSPFAFCVREHTGYMTYCYIRTAPNADIESARKHIKECVAKMGDDAEKFSIEFFDEELGRQYEKERELNRLITIFALISICISLMGVFGLVFFETQYRRREIAVRRVHGAKISQILGMFVGQYARMVLVAFLFAVPVSCLIMQRWLEGYAYHIPLYWWVFALALLIVLAVTSAIVLARSWRAAKENPVEALYKE